MTKTDRGIQDAALEPSAPVCEERWSLLESPMQRASAETLKKFAAPEGGPKYGNSREGAYETL
jgi:hypothetical protein